MNRLALIPILMITGITCGYSQGDSAVGIVFAHGLSWQEVLQKAKLENKYVFVDCYATWCGPCRQMDNNIYSNAFVGNYMNGKFISIRVQMDTTQHDNEEVSRWYALAHSFGDMYHIGSYPCYLFFAPDGRAVHKNIGSMDIMGFLSVVNAAMDSNQQYYTLLMNYREGKRSYTMMPLLAEAAQSVGNYATEVEVASDYVHHYLELLPGEKIWTGENIRFINQHLDAINYSDKIFGSFFKNRRMIDSIMARPTFADNVINIILYRDEIKPEITKGLKASLAPNWHRMEKSISKTWNAYYAHKNILQGQIDYYKSRKNWKHYVKYFFRQKEEEGIEKWKPEGSTILDLNNAAWEVFQYGNRKELKKALCWVDRILSAGTSSRPIPDAMDTKANILYKLGRKAEGLELEEQAHILAPKYSRADPDIQANYLKMKNRTPTWIYK